MQLQTKPLTCKYIVDSCFLPQSLGRDQSGLEQAEQLTGGLAAWEELAMEDTDGRNVT